MLQGCATTLGAHPQGEDIKGFQNYMQQQSNTSYYKRSID